MTEAVAPRKPEQDPATGRFVAGNSGNGGRKKGSKNRLTEDFWRDFSEAWMEHGKTALETVAKDEPAKFLSVAASVMPKELKIEHVSDLTDEQLDERLRQVTDALTAAVGAVAGVAAGGIGTSPGTASPSPAHEASSLPTLQ